MKFDSVLSLKIVNNQHLMRATHRGEYRDLRGALALTSDLSHPHFNCLEGFTTDNHHLESLLDVGFSLLRAFDRPSAVRLTPLDRPAVIAERLARRGLVESERDVAMVLASDPPPLPENEDIRIVRCEPETAASWAAVHVQATGLPTYVKPLLVGAALANVLDPMHAFYVAESDGQSVGTALMVRDGDTAGLYSLATLKSYRRRGVARALTLRAIADARTAGATCISLETSTSNEAALALYDALGFVPAHETTLWLERGA